jgi:hypothetical protein
MEKTEAPQVQEFRPELISRRGELVGWATASLTIIAWLVLHFTGNPVSILLKVMTVLLLFSALAISLGNWMDRRTLLRLEPDGVSFKNGLRNVHLRWDEIHRVEVIPSSWGNKVRVLGSQAHFDFRTLGVVKMKGEVKGQLGFHEGEQILHSILEQARLKESQGPEEDYTYYTRQ